MSQLIAYDSEKELLPVMLANCSYSLEVGQETQLRYNWETLEKQIIDRFIRGRPRVEFEVNNLQCTGFSSKITVRKTVCVDCFNSSSIVGHLVPYLNIFN